MEIFSRDYIKLNLDVSSKKDALEKISNIALKLKITNDSKQLLKAFLNREKESSTGFEDGFAIPHARDDAVLKSSLFFVNFKKAIDWESVDGKKTKNLFVIMIPKKNEGTDHLETLSTVSIALMDKEFCKKINAIKKEDEAYQLISSYFSKDQKETNSQKDTSKPSTKKIIAITACPVGVAHTYLAAEKLTQVAKENGYQIKVETHGSTGIKNAFTEQEIQEADLLIVASDIGIQLDRFNNKKVYKTSVKDAIHKPLELINEAYQKATIHSNSSSPKTNSTEFKEKGGGVMKHILTGISYMIPFVILGGICIALAAGLGKAIYGQDYSAAPGDFLYYLDKIGGVAFTLMIGALGAYISYSIAGRAAIAPAFIVSVLGNTPDAIYGFGGIQVTTAMGFLGSIIFGLLIGYTVKWINTWRVPKTISSIMPIFVIPLGVGAFYSLLAIFVIGAPVGFVMSKFIGALQSVFEGNGGVSKEVGIGISIAIGILIGAMAGFDMGGPINKVAFLTCTSLVTSQIYEPMGMIGAAIPVAPLGMGFCTLIFRNKFDEQEKSLGVSAIIMGMIGISEGAIPFAVSDPKKAIPCNMIGSAVAGGIAAGLSVTNSAAHGGPIVAVLGAVGSKVYGQAAGIGFYFLAIVIGVAITCVLYGFIRNAKIKDIFKKKNNKANENVDETKLNVNNSKANFELTNIKKQYNFLLNKRGDRICKHM